MSIAIDTNTVSAVLLADGWHDVESNSFDLDAYEYLWSGSELTLQELDERNSERASGEKWRDAMIVHGGGNSGVCSTGFVFKTPDGDLMAGPLTAILAVRYRRGA